MHPVFLAPALLAAMTLPPHVGSPGAGRVAIGAGVEGTLPAAEVRIGLLRFLSVHVEGIYHPEAPLVGGGVRLAAGSNHRVLFANAWVEGHLRPLLGAGLTEPLAGSDVATGLGVVALWGPMSLGLDGGLALGLPVADAGLDDLGRTAIDQQGGLFGVQRVTVGVDLGDHFEVAGRVALALPIDSVRFNRRDEDLVGTWDARLGGRLLVRF